MDSLLFGHSANEGEEWNFVLEVLAFEVFYLKLFL